VASLVGALVPAGSSRSGRPDGKVDVSYVGRDEPPVVLVPTGATPSPFGRFVEVSSDGRLLAVASFSGVLSVFDTASMRLVHSIPFATDRPIDTENTQLPPAEAGRYAIVTYVNATTAILQSWDSVTSIDLVTGQKRWEERGFRDRVWTASVSTDEKLIIASDFNGTTRLLRFDDGARVGAPLANGSMTAAERGNEPVVRPADGSAARRPVPAQSVDHLGELDPRWPVLGHRRPRR
jgi:WD40 repeat protein